MRFQGSFQFIPTSEGKHWMRCGLASSYLLLHRFCSNPSSRTTIFKRSMRIERNGGTITVSPDNEAHQSALIVISHGLGDTAEGFADVAEQFAKKLPYAKFILPTAPTQPVTMNMGMAMPSWYDIIGLDERSNEDCKGLEESVAKLSAILQTEHETTGLPYSRMVLAGFSQGGALSLFTGFGLPERLAGICVMSGYLPAAKKFTITKGLEDTKVLHCHGTQDMVVRYDLAAKSRDKVVESGATSYEIETYGIGHTVSMDELQRVEQFLASVLPDDPSFRITLKDPSEMSVKELKQAVRKAGLNAVGLMEKSEFVKLLKDHRNAL